MTNEFDSLFQSEASTMKPKFVELKLGDKVQSALGGQEMFIGTVVKIKDNELGVTWARTDGHYDPYHDRRVASLKRIREGGDVLRLIESA